MNYLLTAPSPVVIGIGLCFKGFAMDKLKQKHPPLFFAIFIFDQLIAIMPKLFPIINFATTLLFGCNIYVSQMCKKTHSKQIRSILARLKYGI